MQLNHGHTVAKGNPQTGKKEQCERELILIQSITRTLLIRAKL
jgi:hypothetical protein